MTEVHVQTLIEAKPKSKKDFFKLQLRGETDINYNVASTIAEVINDEPIKTLEPLYEAIVVGASWFGIWTLHKLLESGIRACLIECQDGIGGVWRHTQYPGCCVDTEVPFYEFNLPSIWESWNWSQRFPSGDEIRQYLEYVCEKLDLNRHIILNTPISSCDWDEDKALWKVVSSATKFVATTEYLLPCTGYTTIQHYPEHPGVGTFPKGYHTSRWADGLDLAGKRVGVIGTGASGVQVIEQIAKEAGELTVFQRTPNFATPRRQQAYSVEEMNQRKQDFPSLFAQRVSKFGVDSSGLRQSTFQDSEQERNEFYESLYNRGGLSFWFRNYGDMLTDKDANQEAYQFWRNKTLERVKDRATAEKLAPQVPPHAFGTKRPSLETSYFDLFNQENVTLVDLQEDPILEETEQGIQTRSSFYNLDVIVYATGFDFLTGAMLKMNIRGKNGRPLAEKWQVQEDGSGVKTYFGLLVEGFPNLFCPGGPQSPTALGLTPMMAEIEGNWVVDCIRHIKANRLRTIEATLEAERGWLDELVVEAKETHLFGQTDSWYMGVNIPGRKKQPLCYMGGVDKYHDALVKCAENGYNGCVLR